MLVNPEEVRDVLGDKAWLADSIPEDSKYVR